MPLWKKQVAGGKGSVGSCATQSFAFSEGASLPVCTPASFRRDRRTVDRSCRILQGLRFPHFQFRLALLGRLYGIGPRLHLAFLNEVAPAIVPIRGLLRIFKLLQFRFCIMPALDNSKHSGRPECSNVMPDDGVGRREVVACQIESIRRGEMIKQNVERELSGAAPFRTTPLKAASRSQLANPSGPWSRRTAQFDPPEGF
jgi:hypothetical protein